MQPYYFPFSICLRFFCKLLYMKNLIESCKTKVKHNQRLVKEDSMVSKEYDIFFTSFSTQINFV
jgi:hypothetical protein